MSKTGGFMAKATTSARQTSRKAGVASTSKKMDTSRHGFGTEPAARPVAGASGKEGRGSKRQPGTATSKPGAAKALESIKTTAAPAKRRSR
jgi:hypothetical protein